MKKGIILLAFSLLLGAGAIAQDTIMVTDLDMYNFWSKTGRSQEKIAQVSKNLILKNKINKRVPVIVTSNTEVNAVTNPLTRQIEIYSGILGLIDNDDELAFIIGHEMAHAVESYDGPFKIIVNQWNSKSYEYKSDLKAIDYMVNAGYDPISAMIMLNKFSPEPLSDWGFLNTHPKGSKRLLAMYKYIYRKYPQYLSSSKTSDAYYKNFEYMFEEELKGFRHSESVRKQKQQEREAL